METGHTNFCVIAAPFKILDNSSLKKPPSGLTVLEFVKKNKIPFIETTHDNLEDIAKFIEINEVSSGLITGARILPRVVIDLFQDGIINFHPGPIPSTSGLDSLHWMINKMSLPGVTVHYIDGRVDAGEILYFQNANVLQVKSLSGLRKTIYATQIEALKRLLEIFPNNPGKISKLGKYSKNDPMSTQAKKTVEASFGNWLRYIHSFQKVDACYQAVKQDDRDVLSKNFEKEFISYKDNCGRGLLSTAAFYSSVDCVTFLLSKGCDPCEFNHKGTTALMFAKTYNRKRTFNKQLEQFSF